MKKFLSCLIGLACLVGLSTGVRLAHSQSLLDPQNYQSLVGDQRAYRVGDAVTVLVQESAAASSSVDASANRSTDLDVRGQALGRVQRGVTGSVGSGSDGGGQIVRTGRVTAQITVTVREVLPNGELSIAGEQAVDLNGERQVISVSGRVRGKDISDANAVLSSRIADASISYDGQGYIAERSRPSILSRFFNYIGL